MSTEQKLAPDPLQISHPIQVPSQYRVSGRSSFNALLQSLLLVGIAASVWVTVFWGEFHGAEITDGGFPRFPFPSRPRDNTCSQVLPLHPRKHAQLWANLSTTIASNEFKNTIANRLSGAVKHPTVSWDDMGPIGIDDRWDVFARFQDYLSETFPNVHSSLKLTKVNTYGLIYEWKGASPEAKPILMLAHQDVVPVVEDTSDDWEYPPFSGHFDGQRIWGRGSSDDKSALIGILSAIENLVSAGFRPTRTIVFASGFDEEVSGQRGAGHIASALETSYGKDAFAFVIDEGAGFGKHYGTVFATPGISEKGSVNVQIEVASAGGHSSIPPDHTSIGMLAAMLVEYENNPFDVQFERRDPIFGGLQCFAEYSENMPDALRKLISQASSSDVALSTLTKEITKDRLFKSLIGTTQAIDIIEGGIKANALPEQAHAIVNHRISVSSSLAETIHRDIDLLVPLAQRFNLTYTAFGQTIIGGSNSTGTLSLMKAFNYTGLDPAPITPVNGAPYQLLSGTIKAAYNHHHNRDGENDIIVAPGMMTGNTDTRYFWNLSPSIFRYNHQNFGETIFALNGVHTVNENLSVDTLVEMTEFFTILILNSDESTVL